MSRYPAVVVLLLLLPFSAGAQLPTPEIMPKPVSSAGVTGVVSSVSGNLISVLNGAITIDATGATFYNRKGNASIADVKTGVQIIASIVNAEAAQPKAGNVIILDVPPGSLNGPAQAVDIAGSSVTMFGARVLVTAATRIHSYGLRGDETKNMTIADIKRGDTLAVELATSGPSLVAESINIIPPMPNWAVIGVVKSIGATTWVITTAPDNKDVVVTVNADTRIDPGAKVGGNVQVTGIVDALGSFVAISIYSIEPRPTPPPPPTGELLTGTVKLMDTSAWVIATHEGRELKIAITAETKIEPGINVGDEVMVSGKWDGETFHATAIRKTAGKARGSRQ